MKHLNLIFTTSVLLLSTNGWADSWKVTQGVTVSTNTEILQSDTDSNSVQAVNSINLNGTNGTVSTGSTQNLNIQDDNLKLEQSSGTAASSQAVNRVYAHTVDGVQQSVTTNGANTNSITLEQANDIGDANKQSINAAITSTSGQVDSLLQELSTSGHFIDYQQKAGTSNVQAGNLIQSGNLSTTADNVSQSHTAGYATFLQNGTNRSIQAGSALLMINGQSGGTLTQDFTSTVSATPFISYVQSSTTSSVQSMNYAGDEL